ncbi:pre-rRNA 2'-O-ribose RNA methyltransferase FTSJ3 [Protopterus annectens]|uniref:pre-rRNA 2'-O-ribose RNA methyltransferase FTSJ3 n=1 Tax=Protopterus annectens TaxID=7888 RepID=UPI001CF9FCCD|nr:pre-rRNA 2'-O-ribose RNA methyltransferase FTSJ3 [Protopterus annectens]
MGKKLKVGKTRKDKFYHLAKETGYRSRSSFKLIQLNRKFHFLQKARAILDLCAAPGGWLQVASKFMPVSSLIIGVDLVPIKPINNVVTLQEDITTEKCRQAVRKELQTWKVDVVLNDGAPNVGANWLHDAYSQAHLTLMALKLACEFLTKGGWFVTKVFRSKDYQPLLWIFQQFFKKVQVTKPQASRNESAEIFVVCQGYLAPEKIDSKFFDPKHAFQEVEVKAKTVRDLVSNKKPKAEGYTEGDYTQYHCFTIMDFIKAENAVDFLNNASEITLDNPELDSHPATTQEIRECCQDIKLLGRKELRALLNWRGKLRRYLAKKLKDEARELSGEINLSSDEEQSEEEIKGSRKPLEKVAEEKEDAEDRELEEELAKAKAEEVAELKRKKKKILKERRKQRERMELKMDLPGVSIADEGETGLFSLKSISKNKLSEISKGDMKSADEILVDEEINDDIHLSDKEDSADEVSLASDLDSEDMEDVRLKDKQTESKGKKLTKKRVTFTDDKGGDDKNPLLVELEDPKMKQEQQTNLWFGKDVFADITLEGDERLEIKQAKKLYSEKGGVVAGEETKINKQKRKSTEEQAVQAAEIKNPVATEIKSEECDDDGDSDEDSSSDDEIDIQELKQKAQQMKGKRLVDGNIDDDEHEFEVVPIEKTVKKARILSPEGLALGTLIATSKKKKRDMIDDSFNRCSFNEDDDMPDWFIEDEKKHRIKPIPLDKKMVEEFRERWREINARPIKKVAEAKARKKRRMLKKMEQAKKKAETVVNTVDISEREKMAQLKSIYKKAGIGKEKREVTYVVAKKGVGPKVRRPPGVKGHFRVVDKRMKKDRRSQTSKDQRGKQRKRK